MHPNVAICMSHTDFGTFSTCSNLFFFKWCIQKSNGFFGAPEVYFLGVIHVTHIGFFKESTHLSGISKLSMLWLKADQLLGPSCQSCISFRRKKRLQISFFILETPEIQLDFHVVYQPYCTNVTILNELSHVVLLAGSEYASGRGVVWHLAFWGWFGVNHPSFITPES